MPFDVAEYHEFIRLLYEHPEWRAQVRQLVLSEEILTLPQVVRELAEAQRRTEQRVEELAEAQKRTEQRVEELAEAQKRTEQRVEELAVELQKTRHEVAGLAAAFGATLEEEAASVLETVMRNKGYRLLQEAGPLRLDGEVDVALAVEDPQGRRLWVLVESKSRLSRRDVQSWAQRVHSAEWRNRLAKAGCPGPYLAYAYAIRADVGAREAVAKAGIGLLKSEGEVIAPAGEIGA